MQHARRRRDGGTAPGRRRRAPDERQSRLAAACRLAAHRLREAARIGLLAGAAALAAACVAPTAASAATYPPGFSEQAVLTGLTNPTAMRFSPDGRVFVAEKSGVIKVFDSLSDTTPTVFADLNVNVYNFWDRGLLGLALAPNFPADPYVYVLYTYDAAIGGTAPRWGTPGVYSDGCPTPPAPTTDGCLVSGRLSRLQASGNVMTGSEQVLIEDWCQQFPSHSIGALDFGPDGALYVSGGDGASFNNVDYGQYGATYAGDQANPCGDPPSPAGTALSPPGAEGGALRSQSVRRPAGEPISLDGAVLRVDPATGAGLPDNPLAGSSNPNARRIVAYGLRNPFRFTIRPGTGEVWIGDVGWSTWEEINRLVSPTTGVANFGWPCYEGNPRQGGYDAANLTICENLYTDTLSPATAPLYAYNHSACVVNYTGCHTGGSSITGVAFYQGGAYPAQYNGALFFADHTRNEIWAMLPGTGGVPNPSNLQSFVGVDALGGAAGHPVDLQIGPGGDLYYVNLEGGTVQRITYTAANQPPTAVATANPTTGPVPLTVSFDGTGSTDPDGDPLSYSWDLDGDGAFDDATGSTATYTYTTAGVYHPSLRVTDPQGASDTDSITVTPGNTAPTAVIDTPASTLTWKVGDTIPFSGHATDAQDGTLPASALSWSLIMNHCLTPTDCHEHLIQTFNGVSSGSFVAPDHAYPSYLELRLTATDSSGLTDTDSVRLDPKTVTLTFSTTPGGLSLTVNGSSATASFTRTVIQGSTNTVSANTPQTKGKKLYDFASWSDGGAQTHVITAPTSNTTYTARFRAR